MHLVFLMVKDNISEVPSVPLFAKEAGIEEVVLTNICHCINVWQEKNRVFVWESGKNNYEEIVKQAEANARALKIRLKRPSLSAIDVPCVKRILSGTFTSLQRERFRHASISIPLSRHLLNESSVGRNTGSRR